MTKNQPDSDKKTESVYVGKERYARLEEAARRIAYITNYSVKTNWVVHNIIDYHLGKIEEDMIERIKTLKAGNKNNGDNDD
ncbi:hypothetical protein BL250_12440 [Erwinia sp. OLTSP20]|uniref:hypothetical protein n=1 Tax=Enterobacterales TaxID=91347 RepID=UPI000C184A1B|nr:MULTISPECIES: hypothetical protein [Enterobacterales]PII85138.1 hypothetical protein BMF91_23975 [Serratia sp. OLFL2]PIJ49364.1 hypothetical protein BV501_13070 [Erwinia sp. OAMSP11]PIJ69759.1 hypothetical protein BK416_13900 [Erwinia sp. OLSSP12]PIJ76243.1 hypothetical protein BLD47_18155 [Erwinia sp. OLCASP19]PIJ76726.1 hypothetical protein BLD46_18155 [Erwinia sp. OLMTSP26]